MSRPETTTKNKSVLRDGKNGNAFITLYEDGTRVIEYEGDDPSIIRLDYPLNVDVKLSNKCIFGKNPVTGKAVCVFCHESATTDGVSGDLEGLSRILLNLPKTTEIAVGINQVDDATLQWLRSMKQHGYIVNGTLNQGLILRGEHLPIVEEQLLYGIGISFRNVKWGLDDLIYTAPNSVLHVIAGIDSFDEISSLVQEGKVKKILVLGEKDFGFNKDRVNLESVCHRQWFQQIHTLFGKTHVSFDNLAIEQLKIRRYFKDTTWNVLFQGERSVYIDTVRRTFAPSSRSDIRYSWEDLLPHELVHIFDHRE